MAKSHLAQHYDDSLPPVLRQRLPDRQQRAIAHCGIQANAPGRTTLGSQLSVIHRDLSTSQRQCEQDIEIAFKHLKSGFGLERPPGEDPKVAKARILG